MQTIKLTRRRIESWLRRAGYQTSTEANGRWTQGVQVTFVGDFVVLVFRRSNGGVDDERAETLRGRLEAAGFTVTERMSPHVFLPKVQNRDSVLATLRLRR